MWLMTPIGFFSAVAHRDLPGHVLVRTRCRADAEAFVTTVELGGGVEALKIAEDRTADYLYRVVVTHEVWARFVAQSALAIDYPNFKNEVHNTNGHARASTYMRVWSALQAIEDEDPHGRPPWMSYSPAPYRAPAKTKRAKGKRGKRNRHLDLRCTCGETGFVDEADYENHVLLCTEYELSDS